MRGRIYVLIKFQMSRTRLQIVLLVLFKSNLRSGSIYTPVSRDSDVERSGSVVECLTRDRRAAGSSLTGVTVLWSLSKTHLS